MIRTVTGDIPKRDLGWCQCHEHLFLASGKSRQINKALCMDDEAKSTKELLDYYRAGGRAYVDAQPGGTGRMVEAMARASVATCVKIVACTGFHKLCFYEEDGFIFRESVDQLRLRFIREVTEGMTPCENDPACRISAKAGIVKVAVDIGGIDANPVYEKLFEAAVSAAKESGTAILAHFEKDQDAFPLVRMMGRYGLPPERLLACHLDRMRYDIGYHKELAAEGVYLEYDTINRLRYHGNDKEIALITALIAGGSRDRLLLSLDTTNERLRAYGSDMGMDYILTDFSEQMKSSGITDKDIQMVMVNNPARALALK